MIHFVVSTHSHPCRRRAIPQPARKEAVNTKATASVIKDASADYTTTRPSDTRPSAGAAAPLNDPGQLRPDPAGVDAVLAARLNVKVADGTEAPPLALRVRRRRVSYVVGHAEA